MYVTGTSGAGKSSLLNANQPLATGGTRAAAISAHDEALDLLKKINDRVRFYYCSASDDEDQTTELAKVGRQPRRNPGSGGAELPGEPGSATFDDVALTLSIAGLPANADSIRAYRTVLGGEVELGGESETSLVSLTEFEPLIPDETYEFWLVGVNEAGEGPESTRVGYTATAPVA